MPPSSRPRSRPATRSDREAPAPPDGWITREDLVDATGVSGRNLLQWCGQGLVPRPQRLFLGTKGTAAFYRAEAVAVIRRLYKLQQQTRDVDVWLWGLWLDSADYPAAYDEENSCLNIKTWALRRLNVLSRALVPAEGEFEAAIAAARPPGRNSPARMLRRNVKEPDDFKALLLWAAAIAADCEQHERLDNPKSPVLNILRSAAGLPERGFPAPDRQLGVELMSIAYLSEVLDGASEAEFEQARRDWRVIASLAETAESIDWGVAMPIIDPIIQSLTGARPEPPSIRARKSQRKRPPVPAVIQLLTSLWSNLDIRAILLPDLISFRRSPDHSQKITEILALSEWALAQFPRLDQGNKGRDTGTAAP